MINMTDAQQVRQKLLKALKIGREAAEREIQRNAMLAEVGLGDFALSGDALTEEALKAADEAFARKMSEALTDG